MCLCHASPSGWNELAEVGRMRNSYFGDADDDADSPLGDGKEYFDKESFCGRIPIKFGRPNPLHMIVNDDGICVIILCVRDVKSNVRRSQHFWWMLWSAAGTQADISELPHGLAGCTDSRSRDCKKTRGENKIKQALPKKEAKGPASGLGCSYLLAFLFQKAHAG
eukprot:1161666-Pelagomonas_calceolata.AAC.4